jgi:hypothetical protein
MEGRAGMTEPDQELTRIVRGLRRFEVIDHRMESVTNDRVRAFAAYGAMVELSFQDQGRTLKVFLSDPKASTGNDEGAAAHD